MQFTNAQWKKAAVFMQTTARPLEQTLFAYQFGTESLRAVLDALAAFQNEDGGFGPWFGAGFPGSRFIGIGYNGGIANVADVGSQIF